MGDFMKWYHIVLFVLFMLMVFSPVWFFRKVESILSDDESVDKPWQYLNTIDDSHEVKNITDEDMDKEMRVLENLEKMITMSKDKYARTMWEIKKAEYVREIRWRRLALNGG